MHLGTTIGVVHPEPQGTVVDKAGAYGNMACQRGGLDATKCERSRDCTGRWPALGWNRPDAAVQDRVRICAGLYGGHMRTRRIELGVLRTPGPFEAGPNTQHEICRSTPPAPCLLPCDPADPTSFPCRGRAWQTVTFRSGVSLWNTRWAKCSAQDNRSEGTAGTTGNVGIEQPARTRSSEKTAMVKEGAVPPFGCGPGKSAQCRPSGLDTCLAPEIRPYVL